jgi:DNA primase
MPKSKFVDFKAVKAAVTMEQVLEHYGLLDKFKRGTDSLSGPCPIQKGSNPTQFRVSISKNIWNCFSECKHGGNTLDFIARMSGLRRLNPFRPNMPSRSGDSVAAGGWIHCGRLAGR